MSMSMSSRVALEYGQIRCAAAPSASAVSWSTPDISRCGAPQNSFGTATVTSSRPSSAWVRPPDLPSPVAVATARPRASTRGSARRDSSTTTPHADDADLRKAVDLREAVYALVAGRLFGELADRSAVAVLNEVAATPPVVPQLTPAGRRVEATAAQALSPVARQAVDILGGPEADLLEECGRPECTQVYLDHSRGFRREWCAMRTCGARMKAAAYRSRKREEAR